MHFIFNKYLYWTLKQNFRLRIFQGGRVRRLVLIWYDHHLPHTGGRLLHLELVRLLIVPCGILLQSSSLAMQSWTSAPTSTHICHFKAFQVCKPCKNWNVFGFQILCTDPYNIRPCIIMVQYEPVAVDIRQVIALGSHYGISACSGASIKCACVC